MKEINQNFKKGDKVRIKLDEDERGYGGENWSKKVYTIYKVMKSRNNVSSPSYYIKDKDNDYTKKYYNNDLLYIPAVENAQDEPERYQIAKLIKPVIHNKKPSYIVHWKYYTSKDDTIEPRDELLKDTPKLIRKYEKEHNVEFRNGRVYYHQ